MPPTPDTHGDVDPLGHVAVGDPDPNPDGPEKYCSAPHHRSHFRCTRQPHPEHWKHVAGDGHRVIAVWTDVEPEPGDELREVNALIARDPGMSLRARYDDDRPILIVPSHNHEISLQIGDQGPVFVDALDLLRVVSHVALGLVYGPSPTELERDDQSGDS